MFKEQFVSLTKIIQARLAIRCLQKSVLGTFPVTCISYITLKTIPWQLIPLINPEIELLLRFDQINQPFLKDVSKKIFRVYKMITGKDISVMLHSQSISTGLVENTYSRVLTDIICQSRVKYLDIIFGNIISYPFIEYCDKELSIVFCTYCPWS